MPIMVHCPGCQRHLQVDEKHAGKLLKCPLCGTVERVLIPEAPLAPVIAEEVAEEPPRPARDPQPPPSPRPKKKRRRSAATGAGEVFLESHETDGTLPEVCMCCGNDATLWRSKSFSYSNPLFGLISPIVAAVMTKSQNVMVPLCDRHQNHFLWRSIVDNGFGGILIALGLIWAICYWADLLGNSALPYGLTLGFFFLIWLVTASVFKWTGLRAAEITDDGVRLKNVSAAFAVALEDHRDEEDEEHAAGRRKGRRRRIETSSGSGSIMPWIALGGGAMILLVCGGMIAAVLHVVGVVGNLANQQFVLPDFPPAVEAVAITPDGKHACLGQSDGKIAIVDLETGQEVRNMGLPEDEIYSLAVSSDGRQLLAGGVRYDDEGDEYGVLALWDPHTGQQIRKFAIGGAVATSVSLSSDGKYAASAEQDGGIRLWDVQTGQEVRRLGIPGRRNGAAFDPDEGGALAVAFSADGKLVAASGYSVQIHLWEADTGKHLKTLTHPAPGHGPGAAIGMVPDLAFLPDGKRLATLGPASIIAWDLTRGTAVKTIALPGIHTANKLIVPSSVRAVTGHSDGRLRVWNLDSGELLHDLGSHRGALAGLAVTRDGKRAVTGGLNGWVVVYDINGGKELKRIRDPKEPDFGFGDEDWDDDE